jgi:5-methylcytosine-specific restriction enzyme A
MQSTSFSDSRRGSRHERGYGSAWDKLRLLILKRDGGLCQVCREGGRVTSGCNIVDHRINKAAGGTDEAGNLRTICKPHHDEKTVLEALAARGLANRRPGAACSVDGMPKDPAHPWNKAGRGVEILPASAARTDPDTPFANWRNGQGGASA